MVVNGTYFETFGISVPAVAKFLMQTRPHSTPVQLNEGERRWFQQCSADPKYGDVFERALAEAAR